MKNVSRYGIAAMLAVTALGAQAQSSVNLYGLIDLSIASTHPIRGYSPPGTATAHREEHAWRFQRRARRCLVVGVMMPYRFAI